MNLYHVVTRYDAPHNELIVREDLDFPALVSGFGSDKMADENILYYLLWFKSSAGKWWEYDNDYVIAFPEGDIVSMTPVYHTDYSSPLPPGLCY